MSLKPCRPAPPPPIPSHSSDRNNNRSKNVRIPTVIRPKMVETPKKKAPPRPPPPKLDSYIPARSSSLKAPVIPPPPIRKPQKEKFGVHLNTKALKKVKIFGKSAKSSTSNANQEFFSGRPYTNPAMFAKLNGNSKKQAPTAPFGVATATLINFDTPPMSPAILQPKNALNSQAHSLLDMDIGEPQSSACLLDMDVPPLPNSLSMDFATGFTGGIIAMNQRKASLPSGSSLGLSNSSITSSRVGQIREETEWTAFSPPPPRCPAPQLNKSSVLQPEVDVQACGMALSDNNRMGELAFNLYDLIELVADHDDRFYLGRLDDREGLVRKDMLEILTPLEDSQQDSEPECLQAEKPPSSSDDKPEPERWSSRTAQQSRIFTPSPVALSTGSEDDEVPESALALYDFAAQQEDELSFSAGDAILVKGKYDADWLYGCKANDSVHGIFPSSFVQIGSENGSETESVREHVLNGGNLEGGDGNVEPGNKGCPVIALYTFESEQPGDLAFAEGETITVLSRINKDWLLGENSKGDQGQFPSNFVQPSNQKSSECCIYTCAYAFDGQQGDDLSMKAGDKIEVTGKISEEWWQGRHLGEQKEGIFPANFVQPM